TEGGRMLHNDDLKTLQEEVFKALEGQYKGLGAFIMSGCSVETDEKEPTKLKITEGLVYINGKFLEVDVAPNLSEFPKYIVEDLPEMRTNYQLASGGIAPKRELYKARIISQTDFNEGSFNNPEEGRTEWIEVSQEGGKTYFDAVRGAFNALSIGHANDDLRGHATLDVLGDIRASGAGEFSGLSTTGGNVLINSEEEGGNILGYFGLRDKYNNLALQVGYSSSANTDAYINNSLGDIKLASNGSVVVTLNKDLITLSKNTNLAASLTVSGTSNLASINANGTIVENGSRVLSTNYLGATSSGQDYDLNTMTGIKSNY
ncbi:hypothetical protein, partial [Xanthovirga aplysinae]|uniref:hypothetical protein n=1 Tax=Xanthovirga aplysinae TaxID=2529853 RepID=UPI00165745A3